MVVQSAVVVGGKVVQSAAVVGSWNHCFYMVLTDIRLGGEYLCTF